MKKFILVLMLGLFLLMTASAFIHVTIPADNCATNAAVVPGDNPTAKAALQAAGVPLPLGNSQAGNECPKP